MVLWGSWANMLLLAKARFELFFFDYIIGHWTVGLIQAGTAWHSLSRAAHAGWFGVAAFGICGGAGLLFAAASLFAVAACDLAGMAISTVCLLSVEMCIGVPLLLCLEGFGTAAHLIFSFVGVGLVLAAVALDYKCQMQLAEDRLIPTLLTTKADGLQRDVLDCSATNDNAAQSEAAGLIQELGESPVATPSAATEPNKFDLPVGQGHRGLFLAACAGVCFAVWPCASSVVQGQSRFHDVLESGTLDPSGFFLVYTIGAFLGSLILLPPLCRRPFHSGDPIEFLPSYVALPCRTHLYGILGGFMHGLGAVLSLEGGRVLGNAVSVSITRCQPLVCAIWGVLLWGELDNATHGTRCTFGCMLIMFAMAVLSFLLAGLSNQ